MCGEGIFSSSSFHQPPKVILKHGVELEEEQEELAEHQPLEQEDLNFERWKRRPIPKRTLHQKIADLKKYLWNAETKEFMGRSGKSWSELMSNNRFSPICLGLILLFYAALYIFLAAMFGGCLFCLMWSISPYHPTFNDRVMPPAYNDGAQERKNIRCTQDSYFMQDDLEESAERKSCQFKRSWLGECSGLQDPHYGYSQGRPCVLLRMNRVNYSSPVVAVRFTGVQQDAHIHVQCKLNGKGIINDSPTDRYLGSVTFTLEVGA
ncbi:hypothetical protein GOODEAATRI_002174 [Goodea atripinnis]|uniref:Protein ATP1B4 n=1 Tax=Goodea atripinnis TaxID=208336 RepID=A0ABV0MY07_9TELE